MTYSCARMYPTLYSLLLLSFESDLKELMKSYQQSLMMWYRRQFVDEREEEAEGRFDGISQFQACLIFELTASKGGKISVLNLSALKITCDIKNTSTTS